MRVAAAFQVVTIPSKVRQKMASFE